MEASSQQLPAYNFLRSNLKIQVLLFIFFGEKKLNI